MERVALHFISDWALYSLGGASYLS